jgi:hypothetical protein
VQLGIETANGSYLRIPIQITNANVATALTSLFPTNVVGAIEVAQLGVGAGLLVTGISDSGGSGTTSVARPVKIRAYFGTSTPHVSAAASTIDAGQNDGFGAVVPIADAQAAFRVANHGTDKFAVAGNGDITTSGSITASTIAHETANVNSFVVSNAGLLKYRTGSELATDILDDTVDWTASANPRGFSSLVFYQVIYVRHINVVHLWYNINGTSNANTFTFTLPFAPATSGVQVNQPFGFSKIQNGYTTWVPDGYTVLLGGTTASLYTDVNLSAWSTTGNKSALGYICYKQ